MGRLVFRLRMRLVPFRRAARLTRVAKARSNFAASSSTSGDWAGIPIECARPVSIQIEAEEPPLVPTLEDEIAGSSACGPRFPLHEEGTGPVAVPVVPGRDLVSSRSGSMKKESRTSPYLAGSMHTTIPLESGGEQMSWWANIFLRVRQWPINHPVQTQMPQAHQTPVRTKTGAVGISIEPNVRVVAVPVSSGSSAVSSLWGEPGDPLPTVMTLTVQHPCINGYATLEGETSITCPECGKRFVACELEVLEPLAARAIPGRDPVYPRALYTLTVRADLPEPRASSAKSEIQTAVYRAIVHTGSLALVKARVPSEAPRHRTLWSEPVGMAAVAGPRARSFAAGIENCSLPASRCHPQVRAFCPARSKCWRWTH
jgi:hypothetical protein